MRPLILLLTICTGSIFAADNDSQYLNNVLNPFAFMASAIKYLEAEQTMTQPYIMEPEIKTEPATDTNPFAHYALAIKQQESEHNGIGLNQRNKQRLDPFACFAGIVKVIESKD